MAWRSHDGEVYSKASGQVAVLAFCNGNIDKQQQLGFTQTAELIHQHGALDIAHRAQAMGLHMAIEQLGALVHLVIAAAGHIAENPFGRRGELAGVVHMGQARNGAGGLISGLQVLRAEVQAERILQFLIDIGKIGGVGLYIGSQFPRGERTRADRWG